MEQSITNSYQMSDYFKKKSKLQLSNRAQDYFSILQKVAEGIQDVADNSQTVSASMLSAYNNLNQQQKIRYLIDNINFISKALNNNISRKSSFNSNYSDIVQHTKSLQTTCEIGERRFFPCCRYVCIFILDKNRKTITVQRNKQTKTFNLRNYLVHRNIKIKNSITIQLAVSSSFVDKKDKSVNFIFSQSIVQNVFKETWDCIMAYRNEQLLFFLTPNQKDHHRQTSPRVFLNSKNFKELMKYKEQVINQSAIKHRWATLYEKKKGNGESVMILQDRANDKIISLEAIYQKNSKALKQQFMTMMQDSDNGCPLVTDSYILEEYKEIYQAIYQKLNFHGHFFQLIFIKDTYPTNNTLNKSEKEDILFMKGVNNIVIINFLDYMLASVTPISSKVSKLTLFCSFNLNQIITSKLAKIYLLELTHQNSKELLPNQIKDHDKLESAVNLGRNYEQQMQIYEPKGGVMESQKEIFFDFGDPENSQELFSIRSDQFTVVHNQGAQQLLVTEKTDRTTITPKINKSPSIAESKKYRYLTEPIQNYDIQGNLMTEHYLFKDWKRKKNGGVACQNQELLNAQKKVFKEIISSMGSQIFKGGNILNVSLPVTMFKKQSHIQMLGKNFVYAPLFLENRNQALEKVKWAVLFSLSVGATGISLQKPFFTFLGQTVQYWSGGCPVYVQQITRYPPVSAYLFIGRGFRIHGQVDPKISFGVNGVRGYSQRPVYIEFDDGITLQISYAKMVVSGLFFGEREFNFFDKMHVYDRKNNLFAETTFGPRQKRVFSKNQQPQDFYHGKIYKVTPQYKQKFEKNISREYPSKKDIINQVSQYQGMWTGKAYFDGIQYYDFYNQLPCRAQKDEHLLPSDSSFRPQLIKLIEGNVQQSQRLKILAEEAQRKDRKLRELHKKQKS